MKNNTFKTGVPNFWLPPKILLIMKLIIVIMTTLLIQASASSFAQRITLNEKNIPFKKVLIKIRQQTGYDFIGDTNLIQSSNPVHIQVNNVSLEEALNVLFANQGLTYLIEDKTVVIKEKKQSFLNKLTDLVGSNLQDVIRGKVVDESGKPLPGATIKIKGGPLKTTYSTTEDGNFSIPLNSQDLTVLVVSYIGYKTKEVNVSTLDNKLLLINLELQSGQLEEVNVVSTGYQSLPKERATGSFEKIDNRLFNRNTSTDIISRLESLTSAVQFDKRSSKVATIDNMNIRGISTLFSNTAPLIVIDNFPYEGDISNINPNDIETVTFLKDAAAASIWGVRAGNGVIVLTTKKGKYDAPFSVSYNANITVSQKPDLFKIPVISTSDYIDVEKRLFDEGAYNNALDNPYLVSPVVELLNKVRLGTLKADQANIEIDNFRQYDVRNDFLKYVYRKPVNQQYSFDLKGGSNNINYLFSAGYDKNLSDQIKRDQDRLTLRANTSINPIKNLEVQTSILYTRNNGKDVGSNSIISYNNLRASDTYNLFPYIRMADDSGNPTSVPKDYRTDFVLTEGDGFLLDWQYRPMAELKESSYKKYSNDLLLNLNTNYKFNSVLSADIKYQYERTTSEDENFQGQGSYYTRNLINRFTQINGTEVKRIIPLGGILDLSNGDLNAHGLRGQLNFNKTFAGKHQVTAIAGAELRQNSSTANSYRTYGYDKNINTFKNVDFENSYPIYADLGPEEVIPNTASFFSTLYRYTSLYTNAAYDFDHRYNLSLSARKDASNLFGVKANQRGTPLWSAGASWNISSEPFYKLNWLPYLNARATYGYSGNVKNNLSAYTIMRYSQSVQPVTGETFGTILNPPNSNLRWEKTGILNFGLDFRLKNNVLSGSIEYYKKNAKDVIAPTPIEGTTGVVSLMMNSANLRGHGIDVTLNSEQKIFNTVLWNGTFIFSKAQNKVVKYLSLLSDNGYLSLGTLPGINPIEGKPAYALYSYKWAGLDPETGDPQGYVNGEVSKDYTAIANTRIEDFQYHGSIIPVYFGAFRNTFSYKRVSISANITYKLDYYFKRASINYGELFSTGAGKADFSQRWQKPGDEKTTNVPSMVYPNNSNRDDFYSKSSILIEKGDHIRLQDINLSYSLDKKVGVLKQLRLFANINNVGILWRANEFGLDPDYDTSSFPAPRTISFGINGTL